MDQAYAVWKDPTSFGILITATFRCVFSAIYKRAN